MENSKQIDYKTRYVELIIHLESGAAIGASPTAQYFHLQSQLHHLYHVKRLFEELLEEVQQGVSQERWFTINIDLECLNAPIHFGVEREQLFKDEGGIEPVQIQTSYLSDSLYQQLEKPRVNDYIGHLNAVLWSPVNNHLLFDLIATEMGQLKKEIAHICRLLKEKFTKEKALKLYDHEYDHYKELLAETVEEDFEAWEAEHDGEELSAYVTGKMEKEMRKLFNEEVFLGHADEDMHRYKAEMEQLFYKHDETTYLRYAELRNYFQLREGRLEPLKEKITSYLFKHRVRLTAQQREQLFYFILFSERIYRALQKERAVSEREALKEIIRLLTRWSDYMKTSTQWALVYAYCCKCFQLKMSVTAFEEYVEQALPEDFEKRCKPSTVQKAKKRATWESNDRSKWSDDDIALVDILNKKLPYTQKWTE